MTSKKCKICGNSFRPFRTTDRYCSVLCAAQDVKPVQRGLPDFRGVERETRKAIRNRSPKRQNQERLYYGKTRPEYLEEHPFCEAKNCGRLSTEIHHKKGRIGNLLNNIKWFMATCHDCHEKIENNPNWARIMGYILSRYSKKI